MEQKILSIGNSAGVIIPSVLREKLGLKEGSTVSVGLSPDQKSVVITTGREKISSITPYFLKILEDVNKRYKTALGELAQK